MRYGSVTPEVFCRNCIFINRSLSMLDPLDYSLLSSSNQALSSHVVSGDWPRALCW